MRKGQCKNSDKTWTISEILFLQSNWGRMNYRTLMGKLNRSCESIKKKAWKLGLTDWLKYHDLITINQLHQIIFKRPIDVYYLKLWKSLGMPIRNVRKINRTYNMIDIEDFFKWYKNHLSIIDLSNTEDGDLGLEPDWLKEKRKADKMAQAYKRRNWTKAEDDELKALLKTYRFDYRTLSVRFKRTEGALKRRMQDLKLLERPLPQENKPWTKEEIETVKSYYLKGYKSCVIPEFVNRSALSINGLLERKKYFGMPPLKSVVRQNKRGKLDE